LGFTFGLELFSLTFIENPLKEGFILFDRDWGYPNPQGRRVGKQVPFGDKKPWPTGGGRKPLRKEWKENFLKVPN